MPARSRRLPRPHSQATPLSPRKGCPLSVDTQQEGGLRSTDFPGFGVVSPVKEFWPGGHLTLGVYSRLPHQSQEARRALGAPRR